MRDEIKELTAVPNVDRIVRIKELAEIIGLSRSSIYGRLCRKSRYFDPNFPQPIRLGIASVGWLMSEIQEWLSARPKSMAK